MTGNRAMSGFTLIELLVVVLIVSLLLAVSSVYLKRKVDVQGETEKVASYIRYMRSKSVTENRKVRFVIDVLNRRYYQEGDSDIRQIDSDIAIEVTAEDKNVVKNVIYLDFNPDGSSSGLILTMSALNRHFVIEVSWLTGIVRIKPGLV